MTILGLWIELAIAYLIINAITKKVTNKLWKLKRDAIAKVSAPVNKAYSEAIAGKETFKDYVRDRIMSKREELRKPKPMEKEEKS